MTQGREDVLETLFGEKTGDDFDKISRMTQNQAGAAPAGERQINKNENENVSRVRHQGMSAFAGGERKHNL